jgi:hypothetical protein
MTKYQLYIYLSKNRDDSEWGQRYRNKVSEHNQKVAATAATPDSGSTFLCQQTAQTTVMV